MTRTLHIVVGAVILCSATACADVLGIFGSDDASVEADLTTEGVLSLTIRNEGDDPILRHPRCNFIERREDGDWREITATPIGVRVSCTQELSPPIRIEPGDEYRQEWDTDGWEPGEYRFKLDLTDEGDRTLSEDARTSNAFRIDG